MEAVMRKMRFLVVGSGWRSLYYVRIAKALPERFELCAVLCRTDEKAEKIRAAHGVYATASVEECRKMQPDFVAVAVNKAAIAEVSCTWMSYGFTVLCETPAALDIDTLHRLWELHDEGKKLLVAEQYTRYPVYGAMLKALYGVPEFSIGQPYNAVVSLAHDYHGASLIRAFLKTGMQPFTVRGRTYSYPTMETLNRYERFTDGRIQDKNRTRATFEFEDGKAAFYDFNSEQYRSPIRHNYIHVQGVRGELQNRDLYYMDACNIPQHEQIEVMSHTVTTSDENPNLHQVEEVLGITCGGRLMYAPPFGTCGLSEDETAVALAMEDAFAYANGIKEPDYPLCEALQDAYMAILMQEACKTGQTVSSEPQPWQG